MKKQSPLNKKNGFEPIPQFSTEMNAPYIIDRFQPKGEMCKSRSICYVKHHGDPL